ELLVLAEAREHRLDGDDLLELPRASQPRRPDLRHAARGDRDEQLVTTKDVPWLDVSIAHGGSIGYGVHRLLRVLQTGPGASSRGPAIFHRGEDLDDLGAVSPRRRPLRGQENRRPPSLRRRSARPTVDFSRGASGISLDRGAHIGHWPAASALLLCGYPAPHGSLRVSVTRLLTRIAPSDGSLSGPGRRRPGPRPRPDRLSCLCRPT